MAKKSNKKSTKKAIEQNQDTVETKVNETSMENNEYQPGFLSNLLSTKKIDSKPIFATENNTKEIEANSEDEKSWEPFDNEGMDEELSKAFENMQKNPEKWMDRLEAQLNDSSEDESEDESEQSNAVEEETNQREETIVSHLTPANTIYVNGISWSYDEESFREFFKSVGEIKTLFLVRQNNGKISGYGAVEFDSPDQVKAALKLNGKEYLGRPLGIKQYDGEESLHKQAVRKEKRMKKKEKAKKQEKKEKSRPFKKH